MSPRIRKLVGMVAILIFLLLYVSAAVAIADRLPKHPAVSLIYFAIVGVAWGLPLFPLMSWMNKAPKSKG